MIYKLAALLALLHCFARTNAQSLHPQALKITAQLIHADSSTPRAMVFNFLNPFIRARKSAAFDTANQLFASEEMVFTQNMTIQYNSNFINLLVSPGDSVHLVIDGARLKEDNFAWLSVSGDHALASTQLNRWHNYFSRYFNKTIPPSYSLKTMVDSITLVYAQFISLLNNYSSANQLLPEVKQWAENDIRYTISYMAVDCLTLQDSVTGEMRLNHALYTNPLFDQYNKAGFQSMMFPYHLANYAHTLLKTDRRIAQYQQNMQYLEAANKALALFDHEPKGLSRDYMLFNYLSNLLPRAPQLLDSIPRLAGFFSDSLVYRYLHKSAAAINNPALVEKPIGGMVYHDGKTGETVVPPVEMMGYFSRKYPGKVIYIDIYATWCAPCLQEMEKMPAVEAKVDLSKIVFVNLCLQSDRNAWLAFMKKKKYRGENYFLDEDATKLFMGMYRVEGFPTYILLDRKGKLNTLKAPRPSDGQVLINQLQELAK